MTTDKTYVWDPYFKGIGQIMLQGNVITGLLFFLGILINSPIMALAGLVAACVGTITAKLLKYNEDDINMGLYGFNATLVGIGLIFNFEPTFMIWVAIVLLSALSSVIMNVFVRNKLPAYTFPFIILVWIALFVFNRLMPVAPHIPAEPLVELNDSFSLMGHGLGFGEVIFQGSLISGVIFFIAVFISSPLSALYGMVGAVFSILIAILFKERIGDVQMGMFSFNAVLVAIALSGPRRRDGIYVLIGILIAGLTEDFMIRNGLAVLTFPFVFATWITIIIRDMLVKRMFKPADTNS